MQNNYCQADDGGSHGIGIAIAMAIGIAIGIAIGDRLSRQFDLVLAGARLNDCSMKHYIVLNMALFSHAHVTISAEIKLTHACSRGDVSHESTAAA